MHPFPSSPQIPSIMFEFKCLVHQLFFLLLVAKSWGPTPYKASCKLWMGVLMTHCYLVATIPSIHLSSMLLIIAGSIKTKCVNCITNCYSTRVADLCTYSGMASFLIKALTVWRPNLNINLFTTLYLSCLIFFQAFFIMLLAHFF